MSTQTLREGRYVVLGLLGQGSQARTFDGFDRLEGRPVAIKRFDVRGASSWKDVELAEREARVLQSLQHPRLPRYVDRFEEDGALYLVMEKIDGESLAAIRAKGGTLDEAGVVRLLRDASEVLDYLHGRSPPVIHRDLKPGNVVRRPDGSFAFVDFGAVRDRLRPEGGSTVVGTFGYMAPEQFQGRALPASDVYALGATALTMLTGRQPEEQPHRGLAIDVRAALGGRAGERLTRALEAMLDPNPDARASRLAPLLVGLDARAARPAPQARGPESAPDRSESRGQGRRARREARRRQRREEHAARRRQRAARGVPFPFSLIFALLFALAMVAVTLATQVVVPVLLTLLSIFVARRALRTAAIAVRDAGRLALQDMDRSRQWLAGEASAPPVGPRVAGDAAPPGPGVRVAAEPAEAEYDEDRDEEPSSRGARRRP